MNPLALAAAPNPPGLPESPQVPLNVYDALRDAVNTVRDSGLAQVEQDQIIQPLTHVCIHLEDHTIAAQKKKNNYIFRLSSPLGLVSSHITS